MNRSVILSTFRFVGALIVLVGSTTLTEALEITPVKSPGGIEAWLVEDHKNPIITIRASFAGGSRTDPPGKPGLAYLVSGLLDEGAGNLDSPTFQKVLEENSISLSFNTRTDTFSTSLSTLTETSEKAFHLMRLAMTEPRFDAEPFARIRSQVIAGLRSRRENPKRIAGRVWWKAAFPDHPYGMARRGTEATLAQITKDDLQAYVKSQFVRQGLFIGVVGDITPERLSQVLDQVFGTLPLHSEAPTIKTTTPAAVGETMIVERPLPQSVVVFGHKGILRDDPDWCAATVLFEILAGGFGSRLTEEIREKRGLTYGVSAYPLPLDYVGLVVGSVSTMNARVRESINLVRQIWGEFGEHGPTDQEVRDAKAYINGSYGLRFTDSGTIAGLLTAVQRSKLGIDYINRRPDLIEAVSLEDLRRVAKRLFKVDELTFAIVGKPDGVYPTRPAPDPES